MKRLGAASVSILWTISSRRRPITCDIIDRKKMRHPAAIGCAGPTTSLVRSVPGGAPWQVSSLGARWRRSLHFRRTSRLPGSQSAKARRLRAPCSRAAHAARWSRGRLQCSRLKMRSRRSRPTARRLDRSPARKVTRGLSSGAVMALSAAASSVVEAFSFGTATAGAWASLTSGRAARAVGCVEVESRHGVCPSITESEYRTQRPLTTAAFGLADRGGFIEPQTAIGSFAVEGRSRNEAEGLHRGACWRCLVVAVLTALSRPRSGTHLMLFGPQGELPCIDAVSSR